MLPTAAVTAPLGLVALYNLDVPLHATHLFDLNLTYLMQTGSVAVSVATGRILALVKCRHLLGKFHLDLLANFLALLVTPGREDVPVLQLLLAGPVS